jgi:hypothetical protein
MGHRQTGSKVISHLFSFIKKEMFMKVKKNRNRKGTETWRIEYSILLFSML